MRREALAEQQVQLETTQGALATHRGKIITLESVLGEHTGLKPEIELLMALSMRFEIATVEEAECAVRATNISAQMRIRGASIASLGTNTSSRMCKRRMRVGGLARHHFRQSESQELDKKELENDEA